MFREDVKIKKTAEGMKTVSLFTNDEKHERVNIINLEREVANI